MYRAQLWIAKMNVGAGQQLPQIERNKRTLLVNITGREQNLAEI